MKRFLSRFVRPAAGAGRYRHFSIRTSLIALVTACLLPAIGALAMLIYQDHLQSEEVIGRETLLRARGLMATVDRELATVEASLQVLAASQGSSADRPGTAHLQTGIHLPLVLDTIVFDRGGKVLPGPAAAASAPMRTAAVPHQLLKVFETGEPTVSALIEGPDRQLALVITVPVRRGSEIVYGLSARLSPLQLGRVLERESLPNGWIASLLDGRGAIVARTRFGQKLLGQQASTDLATSLMRQSEGTLDTINKDGFPVITSHTRSSMSGLNLTVNAPRTVLQTRLSNSVALLIGGGVLTLCFALWFAVRLARNVTRSVEALIEPALALGSGRPVDMPVTRLTEADAVGRALAEAAVMLAHAKHQAHHDALTGLCNRLLFDEVLSHRLAHARRHRERLAVLAIDLDGFKGVNDRHGHAAGDGVLKIAAERIRRALRVSDVVSRRGGDEFSVLLCDVDAALAAKIGRKLVTELAVPYPNVQASVSASIGIAMFPQSGGTPEELLQCADEFLYAAKHAGKCRVAGDGCDPLRRGSAPALRARSSSQRAAA